MGTPRSEGKRGRGKRGEKWSLQSQGNLGTTGVSHFFGGMLALLGNNSAGMESIFGKECVHGRIYYV